jgi:regulator of RNase E activity RraB
MDATAKDSDRAHELLRWAETEMRYAGWGTRVNDQHGRTDVYESIVEFLK